MKDTQETVWSDKWPTTPGHYWFYGERFGSAGKQFYHVEVWVSGNGIPTYVGNGHFWYKGEGHSGKWTPVVFPSTPNE